MVFTQNQDAFILMVHSRSASSNLDGSWSYALPSCIDQLWNLLLVPIFLVMCSSNNRTIIIKIFEIKKIANRRTFLYGSLCHMALRKKQDMAACKFTVVHQSYPFNTTELQRTFARFLKTKVIIICHPKSPPFIIFYSISNDVVSVLIFEFWKNQKNIYKHHAVKLPV